MKTAAASLYVSEDGTLSVDLTRVVAIEKVERVDEVWYARQRARLYRSPATHPSGPPPTHPVWIVKLDVLLKEESRIEISRESIAVELMRAWSLWHKVKPT